MNRQLRIVKTQRSEIQPVVWINDATYKGSAPFSGVFAVLTHDSLVRTNNSDQLVLDVICQMGTNSAQENCTLELVLSDHPMNVLILDSQEEFATHLDWIDNV